MKREDLYPPPPRLRWLVWGIAIGVLAVSLIKYMSEV